MTRQRKGGRHPSDIFTGQPERTPAPRPAPRPPVPITGLQAGTGPRLNADHSAAQNQSDILETRAAADHYRGPLPA